jgi:3-deoxy-D-manno-octulosonate 8-phosphate phosphatase KdsC-like HAD superfamily phosphatase
MNINITQQEHLNNIVKQVDAEKIIYLDFDGIFGGLMLYNSTEKFAKSVQYSARYAIEMLRYYGFEVNVITGDSSGTGNAITTAILDRVPISNLYAVSGKNKYSFIKQQHNIRKVFYAGDDMYDIAMKDMILLTTSNAFAGLRNVASYVSLSSSHDYFVLELANAILAAFDIDIEAFANKTLYNLKVSVETSHEANKLPAYILTENSVKLNTEYASILSNTYDVSIENLYAAIYNQNSSSFLLNDNESNRTFVLTSLSSFAEFCKYNSQLAGEIYLLLDSDLDLLATETFESFEAINNAKFSNVCILTKHFTQEQRIALHSYALTSNMHNVLTMFDMFYDDIVVASGS